MSDAISSKGIEFQVDFGTGFETLAEITDISGPSLSAEKIDVTSLDTVGSYREYITGFIEPGDITLAMNYTKDTYDKMLTALNAGTEYDMQILIPDSTTTDSKLEFVGIVQTLAFAIPVGDKVSADATITVSGQTTFTKGT